jgi:magnesium-dependent phosphatase 1
VKHADMLFFDDEARNAEVESLGVTFILVGSNGITKGIFEQGLEEWRRRQRSTTDGETA